MDANERMVIVLGGLAVFGVLYNRWVGRLEGQGHDRGYMGLIVSLGCFVTIVGYTYWTGSIVQGLMLLACFVASGAPMLWGSIARYVRQRAHEEQAMQGEARNTLGGTYDEQAEGTGLSGQGSSGCGDTGNEQADRARSDPD